MVTTATSDKRDLAQGWHNNVHFAHTGGDTPVSISPAWGVIHQCPFHPHGRDTPVSISPAWGQYTSVQFANTRVTHQCPFHPHGGDTWVSTSPTEGWHTMSISPTEGWHRSVHFTHRGLTHHVHFTHRPDLRHQSCQLFCFLSPITVLLLRPSNVQPFCPCKQCST